MKASANNVIDVVTAAVDIDKARETPVSVLLMVDEAAAPEFQVFVRSGFSSDSVNSRLMVAYYPTMSVDAHDGLDLVVVAAGEGSKTGQIVDSFRAQDVPVLVVAESAPRVIQVAQDAGFELASDSVIAPEANQPLDEDIKGDLADRIGFWMADRLPREKHLAFSIAYPFMRRPLAYAAINATAIQNAGIGVAVFVPGADMPLMSVNQMKMVLQIAAAYGQPIDAARVKELAAVLAGGFVCRGIARGVVGLIPVGGWAAKGAMGFAGTQVIGRTALDYFEHGGDIAGLASVIGHAKDGLVDAADEIASKPGVQSVALKAFDAAGKAVQVVSTNAKPVANAALSLALTSMGKHGKKGSDGVSSAGASAGHAAEVGAKDGAPTKIKKNRRGFSIMAGGSAVRKKLK